MNNKNLVFSKLKPEDVASMHDDILIAKLNPGQVKLENLKTRVFLGNKKFK